MKKNILKEELTPKNDIIFKILFGKKGNEGILKDFLEAILEKQIKSVELDKDVELLPNAIDDKVGVLDVKAVLDDGTIINIEMQNANKGNIVKRMFFYSDRLYTEEIEKGKIYDELNKTIAIGILNFNYFEGIKEYHTKWKMAEEKNKDITLEEQEIHFIELPKFLKSEININKKLDQWLVFLDYSRKELMKMATEKNKKVEEAQTKYEYLVGDEKVKRLAFLRRKYELDYNSGVAYAKKKGEIEGSKEEKQKIAKKMLAEGLDIELIEKITGLTKEAIEKL